MNYALLRRDGETPLQHHKRIVYGKLLDKTLSDFDYTELAEAIYGKPYSSDVARRMMYGSKNTLDIIGEYSVGDASSEIDEKIIEYKKERQKFFDERSALNKVIRERARQEELNEILVNSISNMNIPKLEYKNDKQFTTSDRDMLVFLNDIHYGVDIRNQWNTYNPELCEKMLNGYMNRIIEIAGINKCEKCVIANCGDTINGFIHLTVQLANKENVVSQVINASELIANFVFGLSKHFKEVRYVSCSGNHSRLAKKEDSPLTERLDDLVDWHLYTRLKNVENVTIESVGRKDYTMMPFDIRGKKYCVVHGDYDLSATKISGLQAMLGEPIYCVAMGHLHHNKVDTLNGVKIVMSGSMMGVDDYCIQKRLFGKPEQLVCVCTEDGIESMYDVQLEKYKY